MIRCPSSELLQQFLADRLTRPEAEALEAHVETCGFCQEALERLTGETGGPENEGRPSEGASADAFLRGLEGERPTRPWPFPGAVGSGVPAPRSPSGPAAALPTVAGYEVLGEIGRGAMGVVFKARQLKANRVVALKMILTKSSGGLEEQVRFQIEAEAVARLQHPNIVQIHEVGEQGGLPFFSLEFCAGGPLNKRLGGRPLPVREAAALAEKLTRAVQHAHSRGVVHRDLKPANILMSADGEPKVADFGLAKRLDADSEVSQVGQIMGTPSYMAPEQAWGKVRDVGPAADVYALGAILYEFLAGQPPFLGATLLETLEQVRSHEPVAPGRLQPGIPRDLETICLKCLRKEAERRYASAGELADRLRMFLEGKPVPDRPVSSLERVGMWAKRRPALAALLGAVAVLLVSGAGLLAALLVNAERRAAAVQSLEEAQTKIEAAKQDLDRVRGRVGELEQVEAGKTKEIGVLTESIGRLTREREAEEEKLRGLNYLTDLREAWVSWGHNDVARARERLRAQVPPAASRDLRSFDWYYSWRTFHSERALRGHTSSVKCVAFSPDGRLLVSGAESPQAPRSARLWNTATGQEKPLGKDYLGAALSITFAPDGKSFAIGWGSGNVRVWHLEERKEKVLAAKMQVLALAFAPDSQTLAAGGADGTIQLWDVDKGMLRTTLAKQTGAIGALAFSPDGKRLAVASGNRGNAGEVKVWDPATGEVIAACQGPTAHVSCVAYDPDGRHLAGGSLDGVVRVWDADKGDVRAVLRGHSEAVLGVAFAAEGTRVASASKDRTVRLWDPITGTGETYQGHADALNGVAFSPDGTTLAVAGPGGALHLWEFRRGADPAPLAAHHQRVASVALSPDGKTLATASADRTVKIWDMAKRKARATLQAHGVQVTAVAISPDGKTLASAGLDRAVKLWELASAAKQALLDHPQPVLALAFSPDGRNLATACVDGTVYLWDLATNQIQARLTGHQAAVTALAFTPDGRTLASGSRIVKDGKSTGHVNLWDMSTGKERASLRGHQDTVTSLAFHPDGRTLASGCTLDRTVKLWNAMAGIDVATLPTQPGPVYAVSFTPDGRVLAIAGSNVRLWDVAAAQERAVLRGSGKSVTSVTSLTFSADGHTLVAGSADGEVLLWEAASEEAVASTPK
jgi:WD40 repeat protein/tRNA A-37 threonylcarbamoyl transferase component Bud32